MSTISAARLEELKREVEEEARLEQEARRRFRQQLAPKPAPKRSKKQAPPESESSDDDDEGQKKERTWWDDFAPVFFRAAVLGTLAVGAGYLRRRMEQPKVPQTATIVEEEEEAQDPLLGLHHVEQPRAPLTQRPGYGPPL